MQHNASRLLAKCTHLMPLEPSGTDKKLKGCGAMQRELLEL
jgi:hypothetical protein